MTEPRPFAEYHVTACPPDVQVTSVDGGAVTAIGEEITVARGSSEAINVLFTTAATRGWGGIKNHKVRWLDGAWVIAHLGHPGTILLRGKILRMRSSLADGDTVEPSRGLVFTFKTRADLEEHWRALDAAGTLGTPEIMREGLRARGVPDSEVALALRHFALRATR